MLNRKLDEDSNALTIAIEEDENAPDPLEYLDTSMVITVFHDILSLLITESRTKVRMLPDQ